MGHKEWQTDDSCTDGVKTVSKGEVQAEAVLSTALCELEILATHHMTQHTLEETMDDLASGVKDWQDGHFTFVQTLQEAVRNHGCVDLMWAPGPEGRTKVAVKRMPNRWVRTGRHEFQDKYPTASERPWFDMAIVKELNKVGFPYACELLGVHRDRENTFVATSLATDGDLFKWCDSDPGPGAAREEVMRPMAVQIFSAVRWLHELGIAHRDLSLENILLTDGGGQSKQVRIIDFGMATLSRTCRRECRGKQSYQAPEMHLDLEYDAFLSDGFALGVVLYAMATQDYPWSSTKRGQCQLFEYVNLFGLRKFLEKRVLRKGKGEYLAQVLSPTFVDLVVGLLEPDPRQRSNLGEVCFGPAKDAGSVFDAEWLRSHVREPLRCGNGCLAGG